MTTNVPLRRLLRKIPSFRSLSKQEMDAIVDQMIYKEYKPGDVLWRTGTQIDFWGIIQKGEIVVERRIFGLEIRSVKLSAGDFVQPQDLIGKHTHSSFLARAVTHVELCALHKKQFPALRSKPLPSEFPTLRHIQHMPWHRLWIAVVFILIIFLSRNDLGRIISGSLYLASNQVKQPVQDYQRTINLLNYAEFLDRSATFVGNQEGYILLQHGNFRSAESAFVRVLDTDPTNGLALNNLAVTYFATGQFQQAVTFQQKAAQNSPNSAIVRYNLGLILIKQNYSAEAMHEFKQASYIDSAWSLPYIEQGFTFLQMQDYVNAESAARSAIQLDPSQQSAHLILGIALYNQNKSQEALKFMERAIQLAPTDKVSWFYKALIISDLGNIDVALVILQQLLETTSDPQQAIRITAEIENLRHLLQNSSKLR